MKSCVDHYKKVLHVLLYLANAQQPKTIREIAADVLNLSVSNIRIMMNQLLAEGYVIDFSPQPGAKHRYLASNTTRALYGTPLEVSLTPKPKFIETQYGTEKLCNQCNKYFPNTTEYFYALPPSKVYNRNNTLNGCCISCYKIRSAQYRLKAKQRKESNHE